MLRPLLPMLLTLHCGIAIADEWGSISGQIVVEGDIPDRVLLIPKNSDIKDREICSAEDHFAEDLLIDKESNGLANVFVYLYKPPKRIHPDLIEPSTEALPVTYRGCQLVPHCLICRTTQRIEIGSDDALAHIPIYYPQKNPKNGLLLPSKSNFKIEVRCKQAESFPFKVSCDFHVWISGYWLIVDHPYAALTDKNGMFQIDKLPIGEHTFRIWHERPGYLEKSFKITVTAGDAVELPTMKIDLTRLEKPTKSN